MIIIFIGDNGYYLGLWGFVGKWFYYEELLCILLIIYDLWLDYEFGGWVFDVMVFNVDFVVIFLDYVGIEVFVIY